MKTFAVSTILLFAIAASAQASPNVITTQSVPSVGPDTKETSTELISENRIVPINAASAVMSINDRLVMIDPVGPQAELARYGRPDIVVLTRAHPDHLSIDTMIGLLRRDTVVLAPQEVIDDLPVMISNNVITPFDSGATQVVEGITFTAFPEPREAPSNAQVYERTRGDIGVLMEVGDARVFF